MFKPYHPLIIFMAILSISLASPPAFDSPGRKAEDRDTSFISSPGLDVLITPDQQKSLMRKATTSIFFTENKGQFSCIACGHIPVPG